MSYRFEIQLPDGEWVDQCNGSEGDFYQCCASYSKAVAETQGKYSGPPMRGYEPGGAMIAHNNLGLDE